MDKYLTMWFTGPMQSWGYDSKFDTRRTLKFPTRSGITGILLAALGASGPQEELLAELTAYPLTVYSFNDEKSLSLTDYQVVGNGYDDSSWGKMMSPKTSDGGTPVGGGARLTYRQYLLDRCFGAIWQMPEAVCEKFAAALQRPVFDLFLGRKCCVPSEMIFQGMAESEHEATEILASLGKKHQLVLQYAFRETAEAGEDTETILLADVPFRFGLHKVYGERWVKKELLSE